MKLDKKQLVLTTAVCLLPMLAAAVLYPQLPEQMVTHWSADGTPDGWSSRAFAAFGLPGLMVGLNLLLHVGLNADPKRQNMSRALKLISIWTIPVVSVLCCGMTLGSALGYEMRVELIIPALMGVLFIAVGNYLPKTKQSYTMGIKLPWTLHSEENWNRTHRLGGFLWVLGGVASLVMTLLQAWNAVAFFVLLAVMVGVPTVYSYWLYRKGI